jgi:hypothetical protein
VSGPASSFPCLPLLLPGRGRCSSGFRRAAETLPYSISASCGRPHAARWVWCGRGPNGAVLSLEAAAGSPVPTQWPGPPRSINAREERTHGLCLLAWHTAQKEARGGRGATVLFPCSETSNFFLLRFALGPAVLESEFRADHESGLRIEQSPRGRHYESSV